MTRALVVVAFAATSGVLVWGLTKRYVHYPLIQWLVCIHPGETRPTGQRQQRSAYSSNAPRVSFTWRWSTEL